ncbi:tigger transposable element-derived protein 1-like [Procambarus clarkii]|uniref:tigger transposable element-derived protein 1-like n=1 Tax=Procambarus clarkii TaxID=6728 RepID=UPI0037444F7E
MRLACLEENDEEDLHHTGGTIFAWPQPMKDRLTLVLCPNASGDCKVKPLPVYHSENPCVFKARLNVMWRSNKKSWVTRIFFTEWINDVFSPSVRKYLEEKQLPLKALLVLDNAPAHPPQMRDELYPENQFIAIKFLPPNTTPLFQPMDQEVIANFKKLYMKALLERCVDVTNNTGLTLKEFWKNHFNILGALRLIDKAWEGVTRRTLNSAW